MVVLMFFYRKNKNNIKKLISISIYNTSRVV